MMNTRVVAIGPQETASAAWTRMRRRDIRHLVVLEDSQLVGVLSERDLGGRAGGSLRRGRVVQHLMTSRVEKAAPYTSVHEAADLMREKLIGSLPVMDGDRLVGIVTATDVFDELQLDEGGKLSRAEQQLLRAPTTSKRLGGRPVVRPRSGLERASSRERSSADGSDTHAPLAARVPRALKRMAGRTRGSQVPANIRVAGVGLEQDDREYIRRRLGMKLGKYATSIERVTVRVKDVNGPRGGVDQLCRIKVVLSGLPSIVFQSHAPSLAAAVNGALAGVERAVKRRVQRRRMRPMRAAVGSGAASST